MKKILRAVDEPVPDREWRRLFERYWPSYERFFLSGGERARPDLVAARWHLKRYMPELVPTWRHLVELIGGSSRIARFLTLYRPAPFMSGCSQAVWLEGEPVLVRNYDYAPELWEATLLRTSWRGRRVLAMGDCLWGALDGVNEDGLAVALAFGGRRLVGDGFGIPLIVRYVLETCSDARDAEEVLRRVPSHMAYNVTVLDAAGEYFTAHLSPDRAPIISRRAVATNHQEVLDWPEHTRATASLERERHLDRLLAESATDAEGLEASLLASFLEPPLYSSDHEKGFGTLYTAIYRPSSRSLELRWPHVEPLRASTSRLEPAEVALDFSPVPAT